MGFSCLVRVHFPCGNIYFHVACGTKRSIRVYPHRCNTCNTATHVNLTLNIITVHFDASFNMNTYHSELVSEFLNKPNSYPHCQDHRSKSRCLSVVVLVVYLFGKHRIAISLTQIFTPVRYLLLALHSARAGSAEQLVAINFPSDY